MTVLLVSEDGTRRCDASCYDAKHSHCDCICQGSNHRKGLVEAVKVCRSYTEEDLSDGTVLGFERIWAIKSKGRVLGYCTSEEDFEEQAKVLRAWGAKDLIRVEL